MLVDATFCKFGQDVPQNGQTGSDGSPDPEWRLAAARRAVNASFVPLGNLLDTHGGNHATTRTGSGPSEIRHPSREIMIPSRRITPAPERLRLPFDTARLKGAIHRRRYARWQRPQTHRSRARKHRCGEAAHERPKNEPTNWDRTFANGAVRYVRPNGTTKRERNLPLVQTAVRRGNAGTNCPRTAVSQASGRLAAKVGR